MSCHKYFWGKYRRVPCGGWVDVFTVMAFTMFTVAMIMKITLLIIRGVQ